MTTLSIEVPEPHDVVLQQHSNETTVKSHHHQVPVAATSAKVTASASTSVTSDTKNTGSTSSSPSSSSTSCNNTISNVSNVDESSSSSSFSRWLGGTDICSFLSKPTVQQTVGSQLAGAIATTAVYPLDTLKYRMMAQDNTSTRLHNGVYYRNTASAFRNIIREEQGGHRALFRGVHCALLGTTASWGIYMSVYRSLQFRARAAYVALEERGAAAWNYSLQKNSNSANNTTSTMIGSSAVQAQGSKGAQMPSAKFFAVDTCASTVASVFNAVLTTPIWHVKTRMQVEDVAARSGRSTQWAEALLAGRQHISQQQPGTSIAAAAATAGNNNTNSTPSTTGIAKPRRNTAIGTLQNIVQREGVTALWLGLRMQILLGAVNALYLPLYESMRQMAIAKNSHYKHCSSSSGSNTTQTQTPPTPNDAGSNNSSNSSSSTASSSASPSPSPSSSQSCKLTTTDIILCSSVSKCVIAILTNPLFVIRTRLQDERRLAVQDVKYTGNWEAIKLTVKREGVRGAFRGLGPSLYVTAPRMAITMVLMENIASFMQETFPAAPKII